MKTKEIRGYILKDSLNKDYEKTTRSFYSNNYYDLSTEKYIEATLTVEIPEEKREFTWEEIRDAFVFSRDHVEAVEFINVFKKELGFKDV